MIISIAQTQERLEEMMKELLKRCPAKTSQGSIDYTYVSETDVARLRELKGQNLNAFALALEKMVYQDDPAELEIAVDKRIRSLDRLVFIQQCVFKYYDVPENVQKDVWALVKDSLNSRVRRLRKALRDEKSVSILRPCHKEELPDQLILFE
ncbi:hypothetical protein TELCIR_07512 [Teladorsagia circumcincta]|uniref:Uncharacterized protein n=1 Tax=Teladorsagia circumcincta TaxID=45464 RepID=A0A2G9UK76_TELCI|nr:hypothetical protein TELCIR_07512 [Teladorsagia circumcincta]